MRRHLVLFLSYLFILSSCTGLAPEAPESVTIGGQTYKTGFYGTLFPHNYEFADQTLTSNDVEFRQIKHEEFELFHADIGSYYEGAIYCEESHYDNTNVV